MTEETIGSRVRRARKAQGLTQEALARRADMSMPGVARLEQSGGLDPHYSTLVKLSGALGVSAHWLYTGEEVEEPIHPKASAPRSSGRPDEREIEQLFDEAQERMIGACGGRMPDELEEALAALDELRSRVTEKPKTPQQADVEELNMPQMRQIEE